MCTTFYQYMIGNCLLPSQQSQSHSFLKRFTRHCESIILNINVFLVILLNDINQQIRSFSTLTSICAWILVAMVTPTFTRNTRYAIQSVSIRTAVLRIWTKIQVSMENKNGLLLIKHMNKPCTRIWFNLWRLFPTYPSLTSNIRPIFSWMMFTRSKITAIRRLFNVTP